MLVAIVIRSYFLLLLIDAVCRTVLCVCIDIWWCVHVLYTGSLRSAQYVYVRLCLALCTVRAQSLAPMLAVSMIRQTFVCLFLLLHSHKLIRYSYENVTSLLYNTYTQSLIKHLRVFFFWHFTIQFLYWLILFLRALYINFKNGLLNLCWN